MSVEACTSATVAGADAVLRLTLAAICAAALAVHEAFGIFAITPGRDDGYRSIALNLWDLNAGVTDGPPLQWVPAAWWLVGLGHLGQANAWVLAWLGLPTGTEITLRTTASSATRTTAPESSRQNTRHSSARLAKRPARWRLSD